MAGLLSDVLPYLYSQGDRAKRYMNGLLSDPLGSMAQGVNYANDRAGAHLGLLGRATDEGMKYGPATQELAGVLADSYSPAGVISVDKLKASYPNIDFNLMQRGDLATLGKVVVPKEARSQGLGSDFMRSLAKAADEDGATLALSPASDFGGNKARLVEFYKRFGFVPNRGRNIDYAISESMYRLPSKTAP
jgi:GNAT superfamily N-acetyltransferase